MRDKIDNVLYCNLRIFICGVGSLFCRGEDEERDGDCVSK
jgi:hypothetical protein